MGGGLNSRLDHRRQEFDKLPGKLANLSVRRGKQLDSFGEDRLVGFHKRGAFQVVRVVERVAAVEQDTMVIGQHSPSLQIESQVQEGCGRMQADGCLPCTVVFPDAVLAVDHQAIAHAGRSVNSLPLAVGLVHE